MFISLCRGSRGRGPQLCHSTPHKTGGVGDGEGGGTCQGVEEGLEPKQTPTRSPNQTPLSAKITWRRKSVRESHRCNLTIAPHPPACQLVAALLPLPSRRFPVGMAHQKHVTDLCLYLRMGEGELRKVKLRSDWMRYRCHCIFVCTCRCVRLNMRVRVCVRASGFPASPEVCAEVSVCLSVCACVREGFQPVGKRGVSLIQVTPSHREAVLINGHMKRSTVMFMTIIAAAAAAYMQTRSTASPPLACSAP